MYENMDMENGYRDGRAYKKWGWQRTWRRSDEGKFKRKKKTTMEKNMELKKHVQPKNAVMCLNELIPGIVFNVEQECKTLGQPSQVSVTVNGQKYHGFGSSKQMAKQAAAEAALVSFVKPPVPSGFAGRVEDTTPWGILASFAMFKLFNEWREGRIGMSSVSTNSYGSCMMPNGAMISQTFQDLLGASMQGAPPSELENKPPNTTFSAYVGGAKKEDPKFVPNPAKQVPENAAAIHPVMLLYQMKPTLQYHQSHIVMNNTKIFSVRANIDNYTFIGEGANMKKAKLDLAIKANKTLFGVDTIYTTNS